MNQTKATILSIFRASPRITKLDLVIILLTLTLSGLILGMTLASLEYALTTRPLDSKPGYKETTNSVIWWLE